ncbi:rhomboid family intramembrane serine protease, partial [Myxococcota bacterium]|nr:rhomboid family intramembrane serine protease [Myxococcota bacterium]
MIPLRDDIDPERRPWVNLTLIGLNLAAFAYELSLGQQLDGLFQVNGLVPARVLDAETWQTVDLAHQVGPLFSHM